MSYQNIDTSIHDGEPIELYEFVRGVDVTRMNTGAQDIVDGPFVYRSSPVRRSKTRQGEDPHKDSIKLTLPRGDNFAREYVAEVFEQTTTLTIRRMHRSMTPSEAVVVWKGRIVDTEATGETITITCESVFTSLRRLGLRERFETICRLRLYGERCKANQPSYRVDAEISHHDNYTVLSMMGIGGHENGWFTGGVLEYAGLRRFIIRHEADVVVLSRRFFSIVAGVEVALYPGCDKSLDTCRNKFDNVDNFGGFPWIPNKDPFRSPVA